MEARMIIYKEYGDSKNFMTPRRLGLGKLSENIAYELSSGRGFDHKQIWGVSVVIWLPKAQKTQRLYKLSKCCYSREEAKGYIQSLKEEIKEEGEEVICQREAV